MASLGFLAVYALLNNNPKVAAERFFQPKPGEKVLSIETQSPLGAFDLLGASLTLENDYWIFLEILAVGRINPERAARLKDPLVFAGGVGVWANPWPIVPFADLILAGEAEEQWPIILSHYLDPYFSQETKESQLKILEAKVPGALAPGLWPNEVLQGLVPLAKPVRPAILGWPPNDNLPAVSPILTPHTEFGYRRLVEISRGCPHGCRFCLAGVLYRPSRPWPLASVLKALGFAGSPTGDPTGTSTQTNREPVGLVSPAVADHPEIESILESLLAAGREVSVSSLRLSALTQSLAQRLMAGGAKGLAVAPEAGTARLRAVINKALTEGEILEACGFLASAGIRRLKLYFMLGLPLETDEDLLGVALLAGKIRQNLKAGSFAPRLVVSAANFCPKPQTPFEGVGLLTEAELYRKGELLKKNLTKVGGIEVRLDPPIWSLVQSLLARGGHQSGDLVRSLREFQGRVRPALKKYLALTGVKAGKNTLPPVLTEPWPEDKYKPWRIIDVAAGADFLAQEERLAKEARMSPPCPTSGFCGRCEACATRRNKDTQS
jgi:radical SAM superfamily enzyme YgiQ (UPF0313 family)